MEELCKKQAETIKLLTDIISTNLKQEYIRSIKHICIAIITSFTILIYFFYYMCKLILKDSLNYLLFFFKKIIIIFNIGSYIIL